MITGRGTRRVDPPSSPNLSCSICRHSSFQYPRVTVSSTYLRSCGETTRNTMACCAPGGTNCQHPGQWRETEVGTAVCAAGSGAPPGHAEACTHKPDADMARSHWSCCADLNRASNKCLRQPKHAHTHPGDWRVSSSKRFIKHCSPSWEVEGRVCRHGAVIQASHWSWYV